MGVPLGYCVVVCTLVRYELHNITLISLPSLLCSDDSMESFDSERRPHFPQFSYSASGTA